MSSTMIAAVVGLGVLLIIMIAFVNQKLEAGRLEKQRLVADLTDRIKRCAQLSASLPGQLMTPPLKQLFNHIELGLIARLAALQPPSAGLASRKTELDDAIAKGDGIEVTNVARPVHTEARVKEVRGYIEMLHALVAHANQIGILDGQEAQRWVGEMRYLLTVSYVEFFRYQADQQIKSEHFIQARQAYERAIMQIRKQQQPERYTEMLAYLEEQIALVKRQQSELAEQASSSANELADSVDTLKDDSWRKKNDYE
ncbi:hypothetical protein [Pseudomonas sp. EpS/L25]|uniref:hypothetical protein n=1 Tax=Pseudomonas sp. EpS/L25 TaxID=1749078 RepID=UPI000A410286|nr:hypothetical protein [Pseudomonas sp. EpS/L25]